MISRLFSASVLVSAVVLSACAADPEQAALEAYLQEGEEIAMEMSETGTQFETLMNVQGNMLSWTQAEKDELQTVVASMNALSTRVQAMTPPAILQDVHPLLVQSVNEMKLAIDGVAEIAANPSRATEAKAAEIEAHGAKGEELGNEYLEKMEAAISAEYPELKE